VSWQGREYRQLRAYRLRPGEAVTDLLVFEAPAGPPGDVTLRLEPGNVCSRGEEVFRLPVGR
jgi:hypothetical protein